MPDDTRATGFVPCLFLSSFLFVPLCSSLPGVFVCTISQHHALSRIVRSENLSLAVKREVMYAVTMDDCCTDSKESKESETDGGWFIMVFSSGGWLADRSPSGWSSVLSIEPISIATTKASST